MRAAQRPDCSIDIAVAVRSSIEAVEHGATVARCKQALLQGICDGAFAGAGRSGQPYRRRLVAESVRTLLWGDLAVGLLARRTALVRAS
ncbi:MAG: hypothetical protein MJE77_24065 [Proteobacteria bacterium]|nr:hypothetical protein [Pseudomonadota bacterium]